MFIRVKAPGSCGELIQGSIDNEPFLVTCPIDVYSEVTITSNINNKLDIGEKSKLAINHTLKHLNIDTKFDYFIKLVSSLPEGKGMASSSADISAICQAVALSFNKVLTADEISSIAASIEPTDGIFYEGIVKFNHITGRQQEFLGNPPKLLIALFDIGGGIDTLSFNQRKDLQTLNRQKEKQVLEALTLVRKGIATNNIELIGQGATISSIANQKILYKPCLEAMIKIADECGAVGVNIAHSGTIIGLLFDMHQLSELAKSLSLTQKRCPQLSFLRTAHLISGGLKIEGDIDGKSI